MQYKIEIYQPHKAEKEINKMATNGWIVDKIDFNDRVTVLYSRPTKFTINEDHNLDTADKPNIINEDLNYGID